MWQDHGHSVMQIEHKWIGGSRARHLGVIADRATQIISEFGARLFDCRSEAGCAQYNGRTNESPPNLIMGFHLTASRRCFAQVSLREPYHGFKSTFGRAPRATSR